MAIVVEQPFHEQPPAGVHRAVIEKIVDLGVRQTAWGLKSQVKIFFALDALDSRGEYYSIQAVYNRTLASKSSLHSVVEAILGSCPRKLDLECLVDRLCMVTVVHRQDSKNRTWANVQHVSAPAAKRERIDFPEAERRLAAMDARFPGTTETFTLRATDAN